MFVYVKSVELLLKLDLDLDIQLILRLALWTVCLLSDLVSKNLVLGACHSLLVLLAPLLLESLLTLKLFDIFPLMHPSLLMDSFELALSEILNEIPHYSLKYVVMLLDRTDCIFQGRTLGISLRCFSWNLSTQKCLIDGIKCN